MEAQSRRPEMLDDFMDKASKEHSRAGPMTVAEDAEQRRKEWVTKRLTRVRPVARPLARLARRLHVHEGDGRARGRGARRPRRTCRCRSFGPSIIECALLHPAPGWIDGFKMADPIIRAYGLGQIPEFPGIPEGIVDIIPVDLVVNAILAVAAHAAASPARPAYYHVSSGSRNPLQFHELYGTCASTSRRIRCRSAAAASTRCPSGRSRAA